MRIRWFIGILIPILLLTGCTRGKVQDAPSRPGSNERVSWHSSDENGDGVYYNYRLYISSPMRFFSFEQGGEATVLCFDPLCVHTTEECQAYNGEDCVFTIDGAESDTAEVFYLSERQTDGYRICRMDIARGEKTVIIQGLPNRVLQLFSYKDMLIYTTRDGDISTGVYALGKDGKFRGGLSDAARQLSLLEIAEDRAYYCDQYGRIYENNLQFSEERLLGSFDGGPPNRPFNVFVYNKTLYYPFAMRYIHANGQDIYDVACCYRPLSELHEDSVDCEAHSIARTTESGMLGLMDGVLYYAPMRVGNKMKNGECIVTNVSDWALKGWDLKGGGRLNIMPRAGWSVVRLYDVTETSVLFLGVLDTETAETAKGKTPQLCRYDRQSNKVEILYTEGWTPPKR